MRWNLLIVAAGLCLLLPSSQAGLGILFLICFGLLTRFSRVKGLALGWVLVGGGGLMCLSPGNFIWVFILVLSLSISLLDRQ